MAIQHVPPHCILNLPWMKPEMLVDPYSVRADAVLSGNNIRLNSQMSFALHSREWWIIIANLNRSHPFTPHSPHAANTNSWNFDSEHWASINLWPQETILLPPMANFLLAVPTRAQHWQVVSHPRATMKFCLSSFQRSSYLEANRWTALWKIWHDVLWVNSVWRVHLPPLSLVS